MTNLTFDERLIREHTPEPLEGHTVVVLQRVGESGEKFHSVLEPGTKPSKRGLIAFLTGKPSHYFAFAVDASTSRLLAFSEHVEMWYRRHAFELHFHLWHRVADAQLLVLVRERDPLERVRREVAEVVTEAVAELPWSDVWYSFQRFGELVVSSTMPKLNAFAREHGIEITSLRLWVQLPARAEPEEGAVMESRVDASRKGIGPGITLISGLGNLSAILGGAFGTALDGTLGGDTPYPVWYATNRRPIDDGFEVGYGARLDNQVHLGRCDVFIPASHKIGELGSPWIRRILAREDDRLRLRAVAPMETDRFWSGVRDYAATFDLEHRHALVFIHGYRVSFRDAALRAAQLGYDLGVKGPVAFFSWPSRATLLGYPADGSAVEASEHAITEFLIRFVHDCGADRVHVIAHSMGNRPLLRALQRIVSAAESERAVRFGHLVLAAPDVTRELFLDVADQYRRLSHRTTLYVSDQDRALRASFRLQGPRVGLAPPITCVDGIDTVHVANVDRTLLGHSTFAEARPVLTDIHALLNFDAPPERRLGLIERRQGDERYWEVHA